VNPPQKKAEAYVVPASSGRGVVFKQNAGDALLVITRAEEQSRVNTQARWISRDRMTPAHKDPKQVFYSPSMT
jgi:hypothetical protein